MKKQNASKLSLNKETVQNMVVRSDVRAGGIVAPPYSAQPIGGACHYPPFNSIRTCLV